MPLFLLHSFLAVAHAMAGAVWLGAMCYSFFVLHPRARLYFGEDVRGQAAFENLITTLSQGARWKVLLAMGSLLLTGMALAVRLHLSSPAAFSALWMGLLVAKTLLFIVALAVFIHVSWRLWPARLFASGDEIPALQSAFRKVGATLIGIAGLSLVLGVVMHLWRTH